MLQAVLPVPPTLTLPVTPDGLGVGLTVLAGIIRMEVAPFPLTIPADLTVHGVGFDLPVVGSRAGAAADKRGDRKPVAEDEKG